MSKGENLSRVGVVLRLRLNTYLTPFIHIDSQMYGRLQTPPLLYKFLVGLPSLYVVTLAYVLIVLYVHSYIGYVQTVICTCLTFDLTNGCDMAVTWP